MLNVSKQQCLPNNADSEDEILPHTLIEYEILPRVERVKTLIRCSCVCKAWKNFISKPGFNNLHLKHTRQNPTLENFLLVCVDYVNLTRYVHTYGMENLVGSPSIHKLCLSKKEAPNMNFGGLSHGIICFYYFKTDEQFHKKRFDYRLYNPITHVEYFSHCFDTTKTRGWHRFYYYGWEGHGLCYDSKKNDFNCVTLYGKVFRVHSTKTNFTRKIKHGYSSRRNYLRDKAGVSAQNSLHWLYRRERAGQDKGVLSIDLDTDVCCKTRLPCDILDGPKLVTIREMLHLMCFYSSQLREDSYEYKIRLWAMEESGFLDDKYSWVNSVTLDINDVGQFTRPVSFFDGGRKVLFETFNETFNSESSLLQRRKRTKRYVWYDVITKQREAEFIDVLPYLEAYPCQETLLRPREA